jgi:hypothetical protein
MFRFAYSSELVQLCMAIVAVCFTFWALWDAVADKAVRDADNDGVDEEVLEARRIISADNVRSVLLHLAMKGVFVIIGFVGVLMPPPRPDVIVLNAIPGVQVPLSVPPAQQMPGLPEAVLASVERAEKVATGITRWGIVIVTFLLMLDSMLGRHARRTFSRRQVAARQRELARKRAEIAREALSTQDPETGTFQHSRAGDRP